MVLILILIRILWSQVIQAVTDANGSDEMPPQDIHTAIPKAVADGIYGASLSCLLVKK
jgi:hypothetical protein